jgi:1-deoxyxylulose-5-phosphate synthase
MRYTRLGSSGLKVSRIGLGMMSYGDATAEAWYLSQDAAEPIVRHAVEAGVTFFDTADMYSGGASEQITGRLLGKLFGQRSDYVLATKLYYPTGPGPNDRGLSRKHIMDAVDASLRRLGTDHIDLYQIHRWDPETPIEETMAALHHVVQAGKVRYLGASLMYGWQFAKAQCTAQVGGWTRFVSMQTRYNLVYREEEREMIPFCAAEGVGVLPYSPLARGLLAGNRERGGLPRTPRAIAEGADESRQDDTDFDIVDALRSVATERELPSAQIALAWLLGKPSVSAPIVGATKPDHLDDALAATDLTLSEEEVAKLEAPYRPHEPYGYS